MLTFEMQFQNVTDSLNVAQKCMQLSMGFHHRSEVEDAG